MTRIIDTSKTSGSQLQIDLLREREAGNSRFVRITVTVAIAVVVVVGLLIFLPR